MVNWISTHRCISDVTETKPRTTNKSEESDQEETTPPKVEFSLKEPNLIEKLEEGPKQKDLYESFLFNVIQHTVGSVAWKQMIQLLNTTHWTNFQTEEEYKEAILSLKCWTASDEAFALAVTKNNLEV